MLMYARRKGLQKLQNTFACNLALQDTARYVTSDMNCQYGVTPLLS